MPDPAPSCPTPLSPSSPAKAEEARTSPRHQSPKSQAAAAPKDFPPYTKNKDPNERPFRLTQTDWFSPKASVKKSAKKGKSSAGREEGKKSTEQEDGEVVNFQTEVKPLAASACRSELHRAKKKAGFDTELPAEGRSVWAVLEDVLLGDQGEDASKNTDLWRGEVM